MIYEKEEIIAYDINGEHFCQKCYKDLENVYKDHLKECHKDVFRPLTIEDLWEGISLICDKCKEVILIK